jgi:1-acyl-sn-glycerol-3-phosphate acyltransferase
VNDSPAWANCVHAAWYRLAYGVSLMGCKLAFSLRTEGHAHVPKSGPALLIANHQSFLDPVLVGVAARRQLRYLARQSLFRRRFFRWLIHSLNAVPIDQEGIGIHGLRVILQQLQEGQAVLVFPEGERTWDGQLQELQPGVQLLIKRSQATVVPVGIVGAYRAWPRSRKYPLPAPLFLPATERTIAVSIGEALDPTRLVDLPRAELLHELEGALRACMTRAEALRRKRLCS